MQRFGVTVTRDGWQRFVVPGGNAARYVSPGTYAVEGDASSASPSLPPVPLRAARPC